MATAPPKRPDRSEPGGSFADLVSEDRQARGQAGTGKRTADLVTGDQVTRVAEWKDVWRRQQLQQPHEPEPHRAVGLHHRQRQRRHGPLTFQVKDFLRILRTLLSNFFLRVERLL